MAVDRTPVLKRCRSLGMEPMYLGIDKKSNRRPNRSNRKQSEYGLQLRLRSRRLSSFMVYLRSLSVTFMQRLSSRRD